MCFINEYSELKISEGSGQENSKFNFRVFLSSSLDKNWHTASSWDIRATYLKGENGNLEF